MRFSKAFCLSAGFMTTLTDRRTCTLASRPGACHCYSEGRIRLLHDAQKAVGPRAKVKARINAIARAGIPEVNAMTEGFLDRE